MFPGARKQRAYIKNSYSELAPVGSGVHQGALGPVMFLIYFNYISSTERVSVLKLADDTKLYDLVRPTGEQRPLQLGIEKFAYEIDRSKIDVAAHKTVVLRYETRAPPMVPEAYTVRETELGWVDTHVDLEIVFGERLTVVVVVVV